MKIKRSNIETIILFITGIGVILLRISMIWIRKLDIPFLLGIYSKNYRHGIDQLLLSYGVLFIGLSVVSFVLGTKNTTISRQMLIAFRSVITNWRKKINDLPSILSRIDGRILWLMSILLIAISLRSYFLNQPMRHDEADTFLRFMNTDLINTLNYSRPNNQVLNSILGKIAVNIWKPIPATIRLPAFTAGLVSILIAYRLTRALINRGSGIFMAFGMALIPYLVLYSTNARGYSFIVAFTLLLIYFGSKYVADPSLINTLCLGIVSALGLFSIPTMLFPIAGVYLWIFCILLIRKKKSFFNVLDQYVLLTGFLTFAFTLIIYTPTIFLSNGIQSIIANKHVRPEPWAEFSSNLLPHFEGTILTFSRDIPILFLWIGLILVLTGFYAAFKDRNWEAVLIFPAMLLCSLVILVFTQNLPYARTWIFLIPIYLLMADAGFTFVTSKLPHGLRSTLTASLLPVAAICAFTLISNNAIASYEEAISFPEAETIALYLQPMVSDKDSLFVRTPANAELYFYFNYYGIPAMKYGVDDPNNTYFVVKKSIYSISDMTDQPVIKLMDFGDAALYKAEDFQSIDH